LRLPRLEYIKASSLNEAVATIAESGDKAKILAGGTDLLVNLKHRIIKPHLLVGIKSIPELTTFETADNEKIRFGASSILDDIAGNSEVKNKLGILHQSIKSLASKHIRSTATLGGNACLDTRCWYYNQPKLWRDSRELCYKTGGDTCHAIKGSDHCHALNSSDTSPVMIALDAVFTVAGKKGNREVKASDFYKDNGKDYIEIGNDEILTSISVTIDEENSELTSFQKISSRRGIDFAYGNIAVCLKGKKGKGFSESKIVIGGMTSSPVLLEKASAVISESGLTKNAIGEAAGLASTELGTLTNLFTSAGYKRKIASALVKKALYTISDKTKKRG